MKGRCLMANTFAKNILKAAGIAFKDKDISSFTSNVIDKIIEMNSAEAGFYIVLPYMHLRYEKGKTIEECKELAQFKEFFDKYAVDVYENNLLERIGDYYDVIGATFNDPYKKFIDSVQNAQLLNMRCRELQRKVNDLSKRANIAAAALTCPSDKLDQLKRTQLNIKKGN